MAKKSIIQRNIKRKKMIDKYLHRRIELKHAILNASSMSEKLKYIHLLDDLPKNSSPVRYRRRCYKTGRGRGNLRFFNLSRNVVRELFSRGELVGFKKSSW